MLTRSVISVKQQPPICPLHVTVRIKGTRMKEDRTMRKEMDAGREVVLGQRAGPLASRS